jgi:hypothetical protein
MITEVANITCEFDETGIFYDIKVNYMIIQLKVIN